MENSVYETIAKENHQHPDTRIALLEKIEAALGRPVISFFTSFRYPSSISQVDADMLQDLLQRIDLSKGLALIISSPGGDGIAAERIINICRSYSGTGEFWTIVPSKAKSAATMICMGSSKIMMTPSSELGPIDPQIIRKENGRWRQWSAHSLVQSYTRLFEKAVDSNGNLAPFLQQLERYDERDVENWRTAITLSQDIAIKVLRSGMMQGKDRNYIEEKIKMFCIPDEGTKVHSRPIYLKDIENTELVTEKIDIASDLWKNIYELYMRTDYFVGTNASKTIEHKEDHFYAPPSPGGNDDDE